MRKTVLKKIIGRFSRYRRIKSRFFRKSVQQYLESNNNDEFVLDKRFFLPIIDERNKYAAEVDCHYYLMDLYMAEIVCGNKPTIHYDIGSRIDGFIAHLLSGGVDIIEKVILIDIRPFPYKHDRLDFIQDNAMELNKIKDGTIKSISSLHAIEHFGLGRYGDPIDPEGWRKALKKIQSKMAENGVFYLALPIGKEQRLCFNAHRIFAVDTIIDVLDQLDLISFAYIHNYMVYKVSVREINCIREKLGDYDCGLFIFKKRKALKETGT